MSPTSTYKSVATVSSFFISLTNMSVAELLSYSRLSIKMPQRDMLHHPRFKDFTQRTRTSNFLYTFVSHHSTLASVASVRKAGK